MTKKEIEAAIKPEFMAKLKKLRIKTKFMYNIIHYTSLDLKKCLNADNWKDFIAYAFTWAITPEKADFWLKQYYK